MKTFNFSWMEGERLVWSDAKLSESLLGLQGQPVKSIMATTVKVLQAFFFSKDMWVHDFFFFASQSIYTNYTVFLEKYNKWREVEESIQVMTLDHCHHVNEIK